MNRASFSSVGRGRRFVHGSARGRRRLATAMVLSCLVGTPALAQKDHKQKEDKPGTIAFSDARMIIEFNSTDEDVGIQVFLDGEAWHRLQIVAPNGREILDVKAKGTLKELGLTELFFESEEPSLEDLPLEDFLALFPEGEYRFFGRTVEGDRLFATATFTHAIPNGPVILAPAAGGVVDPDNAVVVWNPVTGPPGIEIVAYQVIVEREDPLRTFSVTVPASVTSVTIPPEFLEPGTEYKVEVLAIEAGGNQTISELDFETAS